LAFLATGCAPLTYTYTLNFDFSDSTEGGWIGTIYANKNVYAALSAGSTCDDQSSYKEFKYTTISADGYATIAFEDMDEGTYRGCAFVDINESGNSFADSDGTTSDVCAENPSIDLSDDITESLNTTHFANCGVNLEAKFQK